MFQGASLAHWALTKDRTEWCPGLGFDTGEWGCRSVEPWGQAFPRLWPLQDEEREDRDGLLFPKIPAAWAPCLKEMPSKGRGVEGVSSMTEHRILTFVPKPPGGNLEIPTNAPKKALMEFWGAVPAGVV